MRLKLHVSIKILHAEIIMWHVNKYVYITMLHLNIINIAFRGRGMPQYKWKASSV